MLFMAVALVFSAGAFVNVDHADAKGKKSYNSGTKNFQPGNNQNSNISKDSNSNSGVNSPAKNTAPTKNTATPSKSGGFMKGLLFGGLAGLMLGGLLGNMGGLGAILGLLINVLFVVVVIAVIRKLYVAYKTKQKEKESHVWKN